MIGRHAQNEIVILDEFVSRYHAEIIYDLEQYFIKDCGSSSGTFLKIGGKKEIKNVIIYVFRA
jgi:pSer/pThr/pTyr-binding forkhead associated (FHA) protein